MKAPKYFQKGVTFYVNRLLIAYEAPVLSLQRPSGLIQKKIRQGPRPDSESDHVKYKAAKRTPQSRSLRFLLTEKNQDLGVSAQRNPKSWVSLPREGPSLGSLCAEYNQELVTSWQARHKIWDFSSQKGSKT